VTDYCRDRLIASSSSSDHRFNIGIIKSKMKV